MEVRTFMPADLQALALQPRQMGIQTDMRAPEYAQALKAAGPAFTATHVGEVIACAGVIRQWENYGRGWALLSRHARPCMIALTRDIRRWLRFHNTGRIDMAVDCDFPAAVRWAKLLGLTLEGTMRRYTADGKDCFLYAHVVE